MNLRQKLNRFKILSKELRKLGMESLMETKSQHIELNIDQLKHGEMADGSQIGRYKDKYYALKKYRQNTLAGEGNVDLINEKNFTNKFDVEKKGEKTYNPMSSDEKSEKLKEKYGHQIFGLQQENMNTYRGKHFMPVLRTKAANLVNKE